MRFGRSVWSLAVLAAATAALWWAAVLWDAADADRGVAAVDLPDDVCIVAPTWPYDPASGRGPFEPRDIPPQARCPVCGMFPARAPRWAAQVIFDDGDAMFLDSPLMLFLFLADVPRYATGREASTVAARWVRDHDDGTWIDAGNARYVHGSRALGPMRAGNLPAFADAGRAARFAATEGGVVLRAGDIDATLLASLDTRHDHAAGRTIDLGVDPPPRRRAATP